MTVFHLDIEDARWVWLPGANTDRVNTYAEFRQEFMLENPSVDSKLYISADSNYAVWVNGTFVDSGQYHDYPDSKTYDELRVGTYLRSGRNVLCVLAYYQGEASFQYITGNPGLIYRLDVGEQTIYSGHDTLCRVCPSYRSGKSPRVTSQLGFTFEYDASSDDGWLLPDYTTSVGWEHAEVSPRMRRINAPRPIRKLVYKDRVTTQVITQGIFRRDGQEHETVAWIMQNDYLSVRTAKELFHEGYAAALPSESGIQMDMECASQGDGVYLILDLGREEAGILDMELDASEGTIVDIAYGEHLEDLRVRASVVGRNFAHRYVCRSGRQRFTHHFLRLAGRYIELHISNLSEKFILHYAGLMPTEYPVEKLGLLESSDSQYNSIYEVSARTLHLCMHEHYEDCPWREQALYAMDARNQALSGYYCFGEYDFPAASFDLLGKGLMKSGYLQLCAPAEIEITIPCFSMAWIMALADHYLYSGDIEPVRKALPTVQKMLRIYMNSMKNDLLPHPRGKEFWHFYEWAEGLDGYPLAGDCTTSADTEERLDSPLNLFFCLSLSSAADIAEACGLVSDALEYRSVAQRLAMSIHRSFWDETKRCYRTYVGGEHPRHYAELVQSLALLANVCPVGTRHDLRSLLATADNGLVKATLSHSLYKYEALMQEPQEYGPAVFGEIAKHWGSMLYGGATSFWETIGGASAFDNAGSLCHGWSGIPAYVYGAYLLGIKPIKPGFQSFAFEPVRGVVRSVAGRVPTPYGSIEVAWEQNGDNMNCRLKNPPGIARLINPIAQVLTHGVDGNGHTNLLVR